MASYDPPTRPRRDGRPRYFDDDASDEESYYAPPRRNRRQPPEDRRQPPEDRRPPPEERRSAPEDSIPPPPFPSDNPRRPSILISPDETASQRAFRRRSRSIDKVRLQASSSDDEYNGRRGPPRPKPGRRLSHDLERKTTDENKRFRSKRNDYESDEGETLRKSKQPSERDPGKSRQRDYEDYDDNNTTRYPPERKETELERAKDKASLLLRGKPRAADSRDGRDSRNEPPVEYGAAPIAAGTAGAVAGAAVAAARPRLRKGYDTDPDRPSRPRTWAEDDINRERRRNRDPDRYDDDDDYYGRRPQRSRPRPTFVDDPEDAYGRSGGGPARRRDRYDDDGYDDYRRRGRDDPYRAERDRDRDRDRNGGSLMPPRPRYDAYYSDSREDRAYPRPRDRDRNRDRDRDRIRDRDRDRDRDTRDDYYDRRSRDRHRDDYYDRDRRDRGDKKSGSKDWQKQAGILFTTYALPLIKSEGAKLVKRELANFAEKRGGGL